MSKYAGDDSLDAIRDWARANFEPLTTTLVSKTITTNGTYDPVDDSADGYNNITVNVPEDTLVSKTITANGTYNPTSDSADGYSSVTVNVPEDTLVSKVITANGSYNPVDDQADGYSSVSVSVPEDVLVQKSITSNGTYNPEADNADGYSSVVVNVPEDTLVSKTITANGTYNPADDGADGYSSVTVNVSGGASTILKGFDSPVASQGNDGNLYFEYGTVFFDDFIVSAQGSMEVTKSDFITDITYLYGDSIGAMVYKLIDFTDIDSITITISTGSHTYNNYATPRFAPFICLKTSSEYPVDDDATSEIGAQTRLSTDNTTQTFSINVSDYTGFYYLVFNGSGCTCSFSNLKLSNNSTISKAYVKSSGEWINLIGADANDIA